MGEVSTATPNEIESDRKLRLFVAIPLWGEFRERNCHHFTALKDIPHDLRWVRPENWHITLKFLGPVAASRVPTLIQMLSDSLSGYPRFTIKLSGLGGFPRLSKCRVLWVGTSEGREELNSLAHRVAGACQNADVPGDKKNFQGHLTLARVGKDPIAIKVEKEIHRADWGRESIDSVSLVNSALGPGGARYEVLETIRF